MNQKISDIEEAYRKMYSLTKENPLNEGACATLLMLSNMKHTLYYIKGNHVNEELAQKSIRDEITFFAKEFGGE